MTDHPCKGMTKNQIAVFERIAVNQLIYAHPRTIAVLKERGLIEQGPDRVLGRDAFGLITVPDYCVPLPVHYQWCRWASEQPDLDGGR
jgi:hypothetical protein